MERAKEKKAKGEPRVGSPKNAVRTGCGTTIPALQRKRGTAEKDRWVLVCRWCMARFHTLAFLVTRQKNERGKPCTGKRIGRRKKKKSRKETRLCRDRADFHPHPKKRKEDGLTDSGRSKVLGLKSSERKRERKIRSGERINGKLEELSLPSVEEHCVKTEEKNVSKERNIQESSGISGQRYVVSGNKRATRGSKETLLLLGCRDM